MNILAKISAYSWANHIVGLPHIPLPDSDCDCGWRHEVTINKCKHGTSREVISGEITMMRSHCLIMNLQTTQPNAPGARQLDEMRSSQGSMLGRYFLYRILRVPLTGFISTSLRWKPGISWCYQFEIYKSTYGFRYTVGRARHRGLVP